MFTKWGSTFWGLIYIGIFLLIFYFISLVIKNKWFCWLNIQLLSIFSVLVPLLACYSKLIPPMTGSFRCDDPSIQFPYQGDTVSTKILLSMVLLPLLIIVSGYGVEKVPGYDSISLARFSLWKCSMSLTRELWLWLRELWSLWVRCFWGSGSLSHSILP